MKTHIFDGYKLAEELKQELKPVVEMFSQQGRSIVIVAILFEEDAGSVLYTRLKQEMAESLGIGYEVHRFSLLDPLPNIVRRISELNANDKITGIIIQKPMRQTWIDVQDKSLENPKKKFKEWWGSLVKKIDPTKDVDGLHPDTYQAIKDGDWKEKGKILPATAKAVLTILGKALDTLGNPSPSKTRKIVIIGKSDLLGKPLQAVFESRKMNSEMIGSKELKQRIKDKIFLKDADVIISATGRANLIKGDMIKEEAIVIDVGEPHGDVERSSVEGKASFLTPVPGGVGPMTVICLMENAVELVGKNVGDK